MIPLLLTIICSGIMASPVSKADSYSDYSYSYNTPLAAYSAYSSYPSYNMFPYQGTVYPATYSQPSQQYQVVMKILVSLLLMVCSLFKASYNYPSKSSYRVQTRPRYASYPTYSSASSYPSYSSSSSSGPWYPSSYQQQPSFQSQAQDSYQSQPVYNAIINDGLVTSSSSIFPSSSSSSSSSASSSPSSSSSGSSYFLTRRSKAAPAFQSRGNDIETNERPAWQGRQNKMR